jgi:hypothetical protein
MLAGWKSADGKLHDYYFTFVQGLAISVGLVPAERANQIMDRLLVKLKEVGCGHFDWRAWDGAPHGYEGLLVDNFLALLAVRTGWASR